MPNSYNSSHTGEWQDDLFNLIYPIGSVYISINNVNPATLFGGTWEQIEDKFIMCAGDTYTGGTSGGSITSGGPSNNTSGGPSTNTSGSTAITVAQMPSHGHAVYVWDNAGTTGNAYYYNGATKTTHSGARLYSNSSSTWIASGSTASAAGSGRGDPSGGTNLVGSGSGHTHTLNSHTHSLQSHTHDTTPPYIALYVWKRTA